jgi:hypothetical protein
MLLKHAESLQSLGHRCQPWRSFVHIDADLSLPIYLEGSDGSLVPNHRSGHPMFEEHGLASALRHEVLRNFFRG